ncbi:MAG: hypothetical protein AAGA66_17425 [Bacteroidota bacterium]
MKLTAKLFFIGLIIITTSCFETEEFSNVPQIQFERVRFVDTDALDSLIVSFSFKDGDGDIGLGNDIADLSEPYQIFNVIIDAEDNAVSIGEESPALPLFSAPVRLDNNNGETEYIFFPQDKQLFSETDNRPAYGCEDYEIIDADTFYVARNEFHDNMHIDFLRKQPNDTFRVIDFRALFNRPDCTLGDFDVRIPVFDPNGNEGTITHSILSRAFSSAFLEDSIKLRFYIYDRQLNRSNTVESNPFILRDIL